VSRTSRAFHRSILAVVTVVLAVALIAATARTIARAQTPGTLPNFTGSVAVLDASDLRGVRFRYEAGARSSWHSHDGDLLILIEKGRGRSQIKGQPIREFGPGEPVLLPANQVHWHGAAPDQGLTWIALTVGRDVKQVGPVSDEEYLGKASR
jgi:quercetin dioxygenase-like cupin family protein